MEVAIKVVVKGAAVGAEAGVRSVELMIWEVTGLNWCTVRVHPAYRFEKDQWFNIIEDTWMQLTHMRKDYQSQKSQHTDAGSGTNFQCQQQSQVQQT